MLEFNAVTRYKDNPEISYISIHARNEDEARHDLETAGYTVSRLVEQKPRPEGVAP